MHIEKTFRQIYDKTYRRTAAQITAGVRQTADAADLIQEVYLELYRILCHRGISYIKSPEAFMAKLVKRVMASYYRRMRIKTNCEVYDEPSEDGIMTETADIESLSVEEITEDRAVIAWTERYLASKDDDIQKIFHLYYYLGMTIGETAQLLGRSESYIKNKLYRTLKEIRTYWKGEKYETE